MFDTTRDHACLDAHAIYELLSWLHGFSFPVTGSIAWLLADRPVIDVEPRTPFAHRVIAQTLDAIDDRIVVTFRGDRVARLEVPPDRGLLERIFELLVEPLHGEVGIVGVALS